MGYVVVGCQCLIGVVFLVSAVSKLRSRATLEGFGASLRQLRVLPGRAVGPVAMLVAAGEATVAALLVVPLALTAVGGSAAPTTALVAVGFAGALGLLVAFSAVILAAMRRGIRAPCRCFGTSSSPLGGRHVLRNIVLEVAAAVGLAGVVAGTPATLQLGGVAVAGAVGVVLAVLVVVSDEVVELFAPRATDPAEVGISRTG